MIGYSKTIHRPTIRTSCPNSLKREVTRILQNLTMTITCFALSQRIVHTGFIVSGAFFDEVSC